VLIAEEEDEMFMTRSFNVTPKTTEQLAHLTARSDKSVAYVSNNKRLDWTFCTVEANYWQWQTRSDFTHEASRGLFVTAELLVPNTRALASGGIVSDTLFIGKTGKILIIFTEPHSKVVPMAPIRRRCSM